MEITAGSALLLIAVVFGIIILGCIIYICSCDALDFSTCCWSESKYFYINWYET